MKELLKQSIHKSMSYQEFESLVDQLVKSKSTSGDEITDAMINYTMLNERRMKRWDKTIKLSDSDVKSITELQDEITWLVITESWCGDGAHVLPVINKVAELNPNIKLKIVLRDENPELMDAFLTNGSRSIPKLIMIDNDSLEVISTYGPRPSAATTLVKDYKEQHGSLTPEFKEDLQRWYNRDKGKTTINDLKKLLRLTSKEKSDCA